MARKRTRLSCDLRIDTDGSMYFSANLGKGELFEASDFPALVGMLEVAKASLLCGRWGIKDAKHADTWRTADMASGEYQKAFVAFMKEQMQEKTP